MTSAAICLRAVEFRATDDEPGDGRTLDGYAAVFNQPTTIHSWDGDYEEEIAPGAFRKTIKKRMPVLQFNHGRDARTGSVPIGSISLLEEDDTGLHVAARLFDNDAVEPVRQAIAEKAITGMSFRFQVKRDQWADHNGVKIKDDELYKLLWEPGDRGPLKRTILEIDPLYELGPVVFPAYDQTSVGVRSLLAQLDPAEHRALIRELAGEISRLPDLSKLTGAPAARSTGRGDSGAKPRGEKAPSSTHHIDVIARDRVMRMEGIL